jgi:hypothetical protein
MQGGSQGTPKLDRDTYGSIAQTWDYTEFMSMQDLIAQVIFFFFHSFLTYSTAVVHLFVQVKNKPRERCTVCIYSSAANTDVNNLFIAGLPRPTSGLDLWSCGPSDLVDPLHRIVGVN